MTQTPEVDPAFAKIAQAARLTVSSKAERFTESVIREMTRLAMKYNAVNLSQGFPDFPAPAELKAAACAAINGDDNQYAITWGAKPLRNAIAEKFARTQGVKVDPEQEITVCCGSTEAMMSSMMAVINPGDEVVIFEPFYENYGPDAILSGAAPRFVRMHAPDWSFDRQELARAFGPRTKAVIINTPNNPTGKVYTREELEAVRDLCVKWNAYAITDEIYEHILYDGAQHISIASLPGMEDRTITVNGMSKTYSVTGWRVGWAIAPPEASKAIRKVHDFLTVGAAAPLQAAGALALTLPDSYYQHLAEVYRVKRDRMLKVLEQAGFGCHRPSGAYYIMSDISRFGFRDDTSFAQYMVEKIGVAVVPGSSFYNKAVDGSRQVRFTYCKQDPTLDAAAERLSRLRPA